MNEEQLNDAEAAAVTEAFKTRNRATIPAQHLPIRTPWHTPPHATNEKGVKIWLDRDSTEYARSKGLLSVQVVYVEEPDGRRTRLITNSDGSVEYENQSLEAIGVHLDIMALRDAQ